MNIQLKNATEQKGISVSQILLQLKFKPFEKCGRVTVYEGWSAIYHLRIKIATDDFLGVWFDQHSKTGGTMIDFVKYWWDLDEANALNKLEEIQRMILKTKRRRLSVNGGVTYYKVYQWANQNVSVHAPV